MELAGPEVMQWAQIVEWFKEDIKNNKFHIYTMENLNDAIEVLMLDEGQTLEMFYEDIKKELKKYSTK